MVAIQIIRDGENLPDSVRGTVATIGVFDGVHLGHQALIALVVEEAKELDLETAVVTFDRHPTQIISPDNSPKTLTSIDRKIELFQDHGIDYVYLIKFDQERSQTPAVNFLEEVFINGVRAKSIYVGEDFQFGFRKEGNVELLHTEGKKAGVNVTGVLLVHGQSEEEGPISSTAIRDHLELGEVSLANKKLGRMYECQGKIISGDGRGQTIGVPTANLLIDPEILLPAVGVYSAWYQRPDGSRKKAAVNIGRRPTFEDCSHDVSVEAHLLDFEGDLYGETGRLFFVKRIREERKFSGVPELQNQLRNDLATVRKTLK
ncbi:MAG TPA: bifunctional riboflavin kinase/FAD synthetase [Acidimicrobiales bacterium]|nr:bifunctional riboflavin kinase/FAD synthetase [Acidimicrobiales bacterium]